jgi:hypothetical protein
MSSTRDIKSNEKETLSRVFLVEPKYIHSVPHPAERDAAALEIEYISGLNISPAVAEFLNKEVYEKPRGKEPSVYAPNHFAFVQQNERGRFLYVTINGSFDEFLRRLNERTVQIHKIVQDPDSRFLPEPAAALLNGKRPVALQH